MYYTLWRNGEDVPNPYTFNTTSLDDVRNFLAWEIVDNITSGEERLRGSSISSYDLSNIDWDQYDTSLDEIMQSIEAAYSKCSDDIIENYKTFDTNYYDKSKNTSQLFYNIDVSDHYTLVISESAFDEEDCFGEYFEDNEFMIGEKPWL